MRGAALLLLVGTPPVWAGHIAANEARTIEHLRLLVSAEGTYQSWNGGYYGPPRCLAAPGECIRGYEGPAMLERKLVSLPDLDGYRFRFHPGPAVGSASNLTRFAFIAVPLRQGVTGSRWFCIDQEGFIREPDGPPLTAKDGGCVRTTRTAREPPPSSSEEAEAHTIADLRILVSAQQAYAARNGGFFDRLDCLAAPWHCAAAAPKDGPAFLDPGIASLNERHGYRRRFYPGASPRPRQWVGDSPTSMTSYAYTAVPDSAGRRAFCTDDRGVICVVADGHVPRVVGARCEPCTELP